MSNKFLIFKLKTYLIKSISKMAFTDRLCPSLISKMNLNKTKRKKIFSRIRKTNKYLKTMMNIKIMTMFMQRN